MENSLSTFNDSLQFVVDVSFRQRLTRIMSSIQSNNPMTILDCGCGDALLLRALKRKGVLRLGIDTTIADLEYALQKDSDLSLVCASIEYLPLRSDIFEATIMMEVLEHLPITQKALEEVRRTIKFSGQLYATVPHQEFPYLWDPINKTITDFFHGSPIRNGFLASFWYMHFRLYKESDLRREINELFSISKLEGLTHLFPPFGAMLLNIYVNIVRHITGRAFRLPLPAKKILNIFDIFNNHHTMTSGSTTLYVIATPKLRS